MKLSVVIPVYNEERMLPQAVPELVESLARRGDSFELLLCENGSRDRTRERMASLALRHPEVRGLSEPYPNYGRALRSGILSARGELVICEEIDLCDLGFHEQALAILERGEADLVIGSKAARGSEDRRPFFRRLATRVLNGLLHVMLDFPGTDTHGLKAFRREAMLPVVHACVVEKDLFASELVIRAYRSGVRVVEIPVATAEKRKPSVRLGRRVPNVLRNLFRLFWVIRVRGR